MKDYNQRLLSIVDNYMMLDSYGILNQEWLTAEIFLASMMYDVPQEVVREDF